MSLRSLAIVLPILAVPGVAAAQPPSVEGEELAVQPAFTADHPFVEIDGSWGFQFGVQQYLPNGMPGSSRAPLTNGFGGGVTGGIAVSSDIELLVDWSYGNASSRSGNVTGALSSVEGDINYDTLTAGARLGRRLGPGRIYGELAVGVVLPLHTTLSYTYAPTLAPAGIMGTGTQQDHYGTGVGGLGELGYHVPIAGGIYAGASLRFQTFETSNDGRSTDYDNFVTDFGNPTPVTGSVHHGTSAAATPTNYSVQDARFHLAIGYDF